MLANIICFSEHPVLLIEKGLLLNMYMSSGNDLCNQYIYGYKTMRVVCYSKLLGIFVMCNVVTFLLNLSKYFVYKLSYAALDSLYCQCKDSDFLNVFLLIGNRFS
jgi:hypothetical protein